MSWHKTPCCSIWPFAIRFRFTQQNKDLRSYQTSPSAFSIQVASPLRLVSHNRAQRGGEIIGNLLLHLQGHSRWFQWEHKNIVFQQQDSGRGIPSTAEQMSLLEDFVFFLFSSPTTLLGAVALLLVLYAVSSNFTSEKMGKEPPGPWPLPLLGNLLQLDLKKPHKTLHEVRSAHLSLNKSIL